MARGDRPSREKKERRVNDYGDADGQWYTGRPRYVQVEDAFQELVHDRLEHELVGSKRRISLLLIMMVDNHRMEVVLGKINKKTHLCAIRVTTVGMA